MLRGPLASLLLLSTACLPDLSQDFTETFLVTDPVDRIEIVVDRGSLRAVAYDLEVIKLKRHTFGLASSLSPAEYSVEDGLMRFEAHCTERVNECTWDHMLELPYGVDFDLTMEEALIVLGDIDGDITATFDFGRVFGERMTTKNFAVTADSATIDFEFITPPESVTIDVQDGSVALTVPAGSYQCSFESGSDVAMSGITCDPAAASILDVSIPNGDLTITGAA